MEFGADTRIAFSLGMGKNLEYLKRLNDHHGFFQQIEGLPHPRWVMQYQYKKWGQFSKFYIEKIHSFIFS